MFKSIRSYFHPSANDENHHDNDHHGDGNNDQNDDRNEDRNANRNDDRNEDRNANHNDDRNDIRNANHNDDRNDNRNANHIDDRYDNRNANCNDDRNDNRNDNHNDDRDRGHNYQNNFSRDPYRSMPLNEKRKKYKCVNSYLTLDDIPLWPAIYKVYKTRISNLVKRKKETDSSKAIYNANNELNIKVALWQGDITKLEIDAIVNAANERCLGGGGVDGSIHSAAGPTLVQECKLLNGCQTGQAKLTSGHKLPAKHVIHTVGPRGLDPVKLKECYENSLKIAQDNNIESIAFCCISTGVFGYPNRDAAHVGLTTARKWLENEGNTIDKIIFCTYLSEDFEIYEELMARFYFPCLVNENAEPNNQNQQRVPIKTHDVGSDGREKKPSESEDRRASSILQNDSFSDLNCVPDDHKAVKEASENVFDPEGVPSANNYAVDMTSENTEDVFQNSMDTDSQQVERMETGSQQYPSQ